MPKVTTKSGKVKHFPYTKEGKMMAEKEMKKKRKKMMTDDGYMKA